ncbi:hypothetical protein BKA70DRAFT_1234143 [Coprinopsis sp. MPI-PUGE-AT-0042]|nr:hypothetical protein BKA70DRAFT_1234143 [Coprinopsis sp. MPI-PUGE-AT-0042]
MFSRPYVNTHRSTAASLAVGNRQETYTLLLRATWEAYKDSETCAIITRSLQDVPVFVSANDDRLQELQLTSSCILSSTLPRAAEQYLLAHGWTWSSIIFLEQLVTTLECTSNKLVAFLSQHGIPLTEGTSAMACNSRTLRGFLVKPFGSVAKVLKKVSPVRKSLSGMQLAFSRHTERIPCTTVDSSTKRSFKKSRTLLAAAWQSMKAMRNEGVEASRVSRHRREGIADLILLATSLPRVICVVSRYLFGGPIGKDKNLGGLMTPGVPTNLGFVRITKPALSHLNFPTTHPTRAGVVLVRAVGVGRKSGAVESSPDTKSSENSVIMLTSGNNVEWLADYDEARAQVATVAGCPEPPLYTSLIRVSSHRVMEEHQQTQLKSSVTGALLANTALMCHIATIYRRIKKDFTTMIGPILITRNVVRLPTKGSTAPQAQI